MQPIHRRSFLDPRRLATSAGQMLGALNEIYSLDDQPSEEPEQTLVRYARPAMGTIFEIVLPFGHQVANTTIHAAFDVIDDLESRLTVYRDSSEISDLNRRAFQESVKVTVDLFELLKLSQRLSQQTQGAFDATAGALIDTWGFRRGPKKVPTDHQRQAAMSRCGFQHVEFDPSNFSIRFLVEGVQINLGSIGKGYALDCVAAFLAENCPGQAVLLHGGKSSVVGIGTPPGSLHGWSVKLEHPWNPDVPLARIYLKNRALATSASTYKHLLHEGRKLGHILDPRTGWPGQGIASATALASSAAVADALSTAFYLMGTEAVTNYCTRHDLIGAVILEEGKAEPVILHALHTEAP